MKLVIIHDFLQAEHWLKQKSPNDTVICTSSLVAQRLRLEKIPFCYPLSKFLDEESLLFHEQESTTVVRQLTEKLDRHFANEIQCFTDTSMSLFRPLFGYYGQLWLSWYFSFEFALKKVLLKLNPSEILVYKPSDFMVDLEGDLSLVEILSLRLPGLPFVKAALPIQIPHQKLPSILNRLSIIRSNLGETVINIISTILGLGSRTSVVFIGGLYELEFIRNFPWHRKRLYYPKKSISQNPKGSIFADSILNDPIWKSDFSNNQNLLKLYVYSHLKAVLPSCSSHLDTFIRDSQNNLISFGLWGNPQVKGVGALIVEYLRTKKIPVGGLQHGGCYAYQKFPRHLESDYSRCDTFFSLGATTLDIGESIDSVIPPCRVIPIGSKSRRVHNTRSKTSSVVYPITNWLSWFNGGIQRIPLDHDILDFQHRLILWLEKFSPSPCVIKFARWDLSHFAFYSETIGKQFQNIKMVHNISFKNYLTCNSPELILIDSPSTSLLDALSSKSQIIVLEDRLYPFTSTARQLLSARIHLAPSIDDFFSLIESWKVGTLPLKIDSDFDSHFYRKAPTRRVFLKILEEGLLT